MSLSLNSTASGSSERHVMPAVWPLFALVPRAAPWGSLEASRCLVSSIQGLEDQVAIVFLEQFLDVGPVLEASLVQ